MQYLAIQPDLESKPRPKQLLGSLPLDIVLPDQPDGLSPLNGVMSHHLHWYKCPDADTATNSECSAAILTKRTGSFAPDFSGQNSSSSPSQMGLFDPSAAAGVSPRFFVASSSLSCHPDSRRADSSHRLGRL